MSNLQANMGTASTGSPLEATWREPRQAGARPVSAVVDPPAPSHHADVGEPGIQRILKLPVPVNVKLAERKIAVESLLGMTVGTIIEFDVPFDSDLTLQVGNRTIGHGQAVKVGERFGLRLSRVGTVEERVSALGHK
jgi:flagellar motor switch protein FliN/FliY